MHRVACARLIMAASLWLTCVASAASTAFAQQSVHETVVVTGTLQPVPFETLSRGVQVLTREQIDSLPVSSVVELLQYVTSLEVRSRGAFGVQADFSIRGAGFERVLVLVNGVRIRDTQTGHHNSDIPVALDDIERVEVLYGAGSSLYGADAFGGAINIITRKTADVRRLAVASGSYGLVEGSARWGFARGATQQALAAWGNRSSGFAFDRDFRTLGFTSQTSIGVENSFFVSYLNKAFGADGFYGASPSREWTDHALAIFERQAGRDSRWNPTVVLSYRTHGDRFLWDFRRPGLYENRHRTHAVGGTMKIHRVLRPATQLSAGAHAGGDWIRSSNLGDHAVGHASAFAELQHVIGSRTVVYPGLRYDAYSTFGSAWSPSLAASTWVSPRLKVRSSVGRAFRIPTFTELYYRDPNHEASSLLTPETAWGVEAGADYVSDDGWRASGTAFSRFERGVIDWVRETPLCKWQTTNMRRVRTAGIEMDLRHALGTRTWFDLRYALLDTHAEGLTLLSKYVLDYPRHTLGLSGALSLPRQVTIGHRLDYTRRHDGRHYWVLDARLMVPMGRVRFFLDGSNLLDTDYQEIIGVPMPGRWLKAGLQLGGF